LKLFGTDGIRGRWGEAPLCKETVAALANALLIHYDGTIAVLQDTRESGREICEILLETLGERGVFLGVLPTPALSVALEQGVAIAGLAVTASHNPWRDNGLKVVGPKGHKLTLEKEFEIESTMQSADTPNNSVAGAHSVLNGESIYVERIVSMFEEGCLSGVRVVVDPANGAAYRTAPAILRRLGAEVMTINDSPDGRNINYRCGALHPDVVGEAVSTGGFSVGIALDGDADRCILVDRSGGVLDGDALIYLLAKDLCSGDDGVVGTVMSNAALESGVLALGYGFCRTPVGDRNIAAELLNRGWSVGGESSGHVLMAGALPTGDGLVTAIRVMLGGLDFHGRLDGWTLAPQENRSVRVSSKPPLEDLAELKSGVLTAKSDGVERVLLRYSGTESLLRILVEADDAEVAKKWATKLAEIAEESI
jgi:phosphoglucosamine mutase